MLGKSEVERGVDFYGVFWRYFHVATASTLEEATLYQVPPTEVKHPVLHDVPLQVLPPGSVPGLEVEGGAAASVRAHF